MSWYVALLPDRLILREGRFMPSSIFPQERRNLEERLEESIGRRRLIEQQVELINGMLLSQGMFLKSLQENAAAIAKAAPK